MDQLPLTQPQTWQQTAETLAMVAAALMLGAGRALDWWQRRSRKTSSSSPLRYALSVSEQRPDGGTDAPRRYVVEVSEC